MILLVLIFPTRKYFYVLRLRNSLTEGSQDISLISSISLTTDSLPITSVQNCIVVTKTYFWSYHHLKASQNEKFSIKRSGLFCWSFSHTELQCTYTHALNLTSFFILRASTSVVLHNPHFSLRSGDVQNQVIAWWFQCFFFIRKALPLL